MGIYGKIYNYTVGNRSTTIDPETALWIGRMLVGEGWQGKKGPAVLWAMMNRFMYSPHEYKSFLSLIRNFSQPINDRWLPGGDLFERYKKSKKEVYEIATSDNAVKRRMRIRSLSWNDFPNELQQLIGKFMIGTLPYPSIFKGKRIDNFASYKGVDKKYPGGLWIGKEYFLQQFKGKQQNINKPKLNAETLTGGGSFILLLLGSLFAFYALRKKRK